MFNRYMLANAREFLRSAMARGYEAPYRAIRDAAERLGWPEAFKRDLYRWDRRTLMRRSCTKPFAWYVYPAGTHIVLPDVQDRHSVAWWVAMVSREFEGGRWFWWDGTTLREADVDSIVIAAESLPK